MSPRPIHLQPKRANSCEYLSNSSFSPPVKGETEHCRQHFQSSENSHPCGAFLDAQDLGDFWVGKFVPKPQDQRQPQVLRQFLNCNLHSVLLIPFARNCFNVSEGKSFVAGAKIFLKRFGHSIRCLALPLLGLVDDDAKEPSPERRLLAEILK
jgi:hypothetical protein